MGVAAVEGGGQAGSSHAAAAEAQGGAEEAGEEAEADGDTDMTFLDPALNPRLPRIQLLRLLLTACLEKVGKATCADGSQAGTGCLGWESAVRRRRKEAAGCRGGERALLCR
jgi:hypothetical protein